MRSIFATRGTELLIVAANIEGAALLLNDYSGNPPGIHYRFSVDDLEPCTIYTLAPGYFPREVSRVADASRSGQLFITRGF